MVNRWTKTLALGGTYMIPPWPTYARERLFRDNCFSYTRELRLLMNIFYIKRNAVDTGRTSIMHLNWPWIGVLAKPQGVKPSFRGPQPGLRRAFNQASKGLRLASPLPALGGF